MTFLDAQRVRNARARDAFEAFMGSVDDGDLLAALRALDELRLLVADEMAEVAEWTS